MATVHFKGFKFPTMTTASYHESSLKIKETHRVPTVWILLCNCAPQPQWDCAQVTLVSISNLPVWLSLLRPLGTLSCSMGCLNPAQYLFHSHLHYFLLGNMLPPRLTFPPPVPEWVPASMTPIIFPWLSEIPFQQRNTIKYIKKDSKKE